MRWPPSRRDLASPGEPRDRSSALSAALAWTLYTNAFIAGGALLLTASTYPLLGDRARVGVGAWVVGLSTLVVYNLDRVLARPLEDQAADSPRLAWNARHQPLLWILTAAAAGAAGALAWNLPWTTLGILAALGVVSVGYCLPLAPGGGAAGGRRRRLKDLVGAKLFLIALVWTAATVLVPATLIHGKAVQAAATGGEPAGVWGAELGWIALGRLLFFIAICLPFDVRDMERDRRSGIVTLPHVLGLGGTRWMIRACLAGFAGCALLGGAAWPGLWIAGGYVLVLTELLGPGRSDVYYSLWIDGAIHIQALAVLAWVWASAGFPGPAG